MHIIHSYFWITLLTVLYCGSLFAQIGDNQSYRNQNFEIISEGDGLSDPNVYCITQDSTGKIWIGTKGGLNSYDGYRMKTYRHNSDDSESISNSDIKCFFHYADTLLYIGTDNGLSVLNLNKETFELIECTRDHSVRFVTKDRDDNLWIGTNRGLLKRSGTDGAWRKYSSEDEQWNLPADYILYGMVDKSGDVIVGTYQYICVKERDSEHFKKIRIPFDRINQNRMVSYLIEDIENPDRVYVGTEQGLYLTDVKSGRSRLLLTASVTSLEYDMEQNLWIGTHQGVFIKKKENDKPEVLFDDNLRFGPSRQIWFLFMDRDANMWIGTDNGIAIFSTNDHLQFVSVKDLLGREISLSIHYITSDDYDNLWLGTSNGLIRYGVESGRSEYFTTLGPQDKTLSYPKINHLLADGNSLWIATDNGLNRYSYETGKIQQFSIDAPEQSFHASWIYSIFADREDNLWLGTYENGVFVIDKGHLPASGNKLLYADHHYNSKTPPVLSSNIVSSIEGDSHGRILLGTDYSGLNIFDPAQRSVRILNSADSRLSSNNIRQIISDKEGNVYIATDNGIDMIKNGAEEISPMTEQIREPVMFVAPENGNLWFKTVGGVKRMSATDKAVASYSLDGRNYNTAYYYEKYNRMYFGTFNGFLTFEPDSVRGNDSTRPITLTNILLANVPVRIGRKYNNNIILPTTLGGLKEIFLKYSQNSFSIEFSSFIFRQKKEVSYLYRLYGFDDNWQTNDGKDNKISFINIPPGKYQFQIKNSEDTEGKNVTTLGITIRNPWYTSWYALLAYCFISLFLVWQLWRIVNYKRMLDYEKLEKKKAAELASLKAEFFTNVSHDLKTPLSIVLERTGQIIGSTDNEEIRNSLLSVHRNGQKIHRLINQLLDYGDNRNVELILTGTDLGNFIGSIVGQFKEQFDYKKITFSYHREKLGYMFYIDQMSIESAVGNLLSNAVKFTEEGGHIDISLRPFAETDEELTAEFSITDDGCGIPSEDLDKVFNRYYQSEHSKHMNRGGSGIGLYMFKKIIEDHNGSVSIDSEVGKGTCVKFYLTTLKSHPIEDPVEMKENTPSPAAKNKHEKSRKPTVLVVEDNVEISDLIRDTLSRKFNILTAYDGEAGLRMCLAELPDLVVTDLMMPKMDGLQMSKILKANINTALIPIIVLTAKSDVRTEMEVRAAYVDSFIPKPLNINYLEQRIAFLISKQNRQEEKLRQRDIVSPREENAVSLDEKLLAQITGIIEHNLMDSSLNVSALCNQLGLSEKYVYRKVKTLTGLSVVEYIRSIRLKKAAMYLKQNKLSVSEIMLLVGFSNNNYFAKSFRTKYGVTPKEYAKRYADKEN